MVAAAPPPAEHSALLAGAALVDLKLSQIVADLRVQSRAVISEDWCRELADVLKDGGELEPPVVFRDKTTPAGVVYWLASGYHRRRAHEIAGRKGMTCRVIDGTLRDAVLFSAGCNAKALLRRSRKDKEHAAEMLLRDPEWRNWSDSEIGRRTHVHRHLVAAVRKHLKEAEREARRKAAEAAAKKAAEEEEKRKAAEAKPIRLGEDEKPDKGAPWQVAKGQDDKDDEGGEDSRVHVRNGKVVTQRHAAIGKAQRGLEPLDPADLPKYGPATDRVARKFYRRCYREAACLGREWRRHALAKLLWAEASEAAAKKLPQTRFEDGDWYERAGRVLAPPPPAEAEGA